MFLCKKDSYYEDNIRIPPAIKAIEGVPKGLFAIGGIKVDLEQLFGCSVDVVRLRERMDSFFKEQIMEEVIYV